MSSNRVENSKRTSSASCGIGGFGIKKNAKDKKMSYIPDESSNVQELMKFLHEEECEGIDETCIGISRKKRIRGLYAKEAFQVGEFIMAIPVVSTIDIFHTTEEVSDVEKGLAFLQKLDDHKKHSEKSKWESYLKCLPTQNQHFDATPDFWTDNDIYELQVPKLIQETLERRQEIQSLANQYKVDYDKLQFAAWLVRSRMFTTVKKIPSSSIYDGTNKRNLNTDTVALTEDLEEKICLRRNVLIPYMDMLNHASANESNAAIQIIEGRTDEESMYSVQATKYIPAGKEILITYGTGQETILDLFTKYGFIHHNENNDNNCVELIQYNWTTTLEEDQELLKTNIALEKTKQKAISLRIYLKQLERKRQTRENGK